MPPIRNKKQPNLYNLRPRQHRATSDPKVPVVRGSSPEEPAWPDPGVSITIESDSRGGPLASEDQEDICAEPSNDQTSALEGVMVLPAVGNKILATHLQNHEKALDKAIREILVLPFTCSRCGNSMGHGLLFADCECVSG
jgi:hypothetical protein